MFLRLTHIWSVDIWCAHILWGAPPGSWWAVGGRRGCWDSGLACSHSWPHVPCRDIQRAKITNICFHFTVSHVTFIEKPMKSSILSNRSSLLACGQLDSEWAAQRVHLVCSGLPGNCGIGGCGPCGCTCCGPAAIFTVDKQFSDLLSYCNVVHHDC